MIYIFNELYIYLMRLNEFSSKEVIDVSDIIGLINNILVTLNGTPTISNLSYGFDNFASCHRRTCK